MLCTRLTGLTGRRQLLRSAATFSAQRKILQRNRACGFPDHGQYDYLREGIAESLTERMSDIARDFPTILDLGCGKGHVYKHVNSHVTQHVIECDTAAKCLEVPRNPPEGVTTEQVLLTEDSVLDQFEGNSQDIIVSSLWLHWVNDLPGLFKEVNRVLKPDGVFMGAMFSTDTIYQLRVSLQQAELERTGGISPHVSPFVTPQDIGSLLHTAKFCMITLDSDLITASYPNMHYIMTDLQGMAENSCLGSGVPTLRRDVLTGAAAIYQSLYAEPDGNLPLSFNVLYFIAWKESGSQGTPKARGSQNASIADLERIMDDFRKPPPTEG